MMMIFKGNINQVQDRLNYLERLYGAQAHMAVIIADSKLNCHPIMAQALKGFIKF